MKLTESEQMDLESILGDIIDAFNEAIEQKRGTMTLQSKVGSRFHERVQRVLDEVLTSETVK